VQNKLVLRLVYRLLNTKTNTKTNTHHISSFDRTFVMEEVSNSDAQFWLCHGPPNNRLMSCSVFYHFDKPVDVDLLRERLSVLISSSIIFQRNVVEINKIPYWQKVTPDCHLLLRVLNKEESMDTWRQWSDDAVSEVAEVGEGAPLFRTCLTHDHKTWAFTWHHIISDLEGMFNKHSQFIFQHKKERTKHGYQLADKAPAQNNPPRSNTYSEIVEYAYSKVYSFVGNLINIYRPCAPSSDTEFSVTRFEFPIDIDTLAAQGIQCGLPISDVFSLLAMRTIVRYHETIGDSHTIMQPITSPLSLRRNASDSSNDTVGNQRALKIFPVIFPLEPMDIMCKRLSELSPTSGYDYDSAGAFLKRLKPYQSFETFMRRMAFPDYVSNYFPMADDKLSLNDATVLRHDLRVCMVPYERSKFAWSHYNDKVQLFLHMAPEVNDFRVMEQVFRNTLDEVLDYFQGHL
jgi:hypothetical protein